MTAHPRLGRLVATISLSLFGSVGCASSAAFVEPQSARVPVVSTSHAGAPRAELPAAARRATFLFVPAAGDETSASTSSALQSGLTRAGYRLVTDAGAPHDFSLVTEVKATANAGPSDASSKELQVSVALMRDDDIVEWLVLPVSSNSGAPSEGVLDELVDRLSASSSLRSLLARVSNEVAARRAQVAVTGPRIELANAAAGDLSSAALRRCRNGKRAGDCDKVNDYLRDQPQGPRADDARAALALSRIAK